MSRLSYISAPAPRCTSCASDRVKRHGKTRQGEQRYQCLRCGEQMIDRKHQKPQGSGVIAGPIVIGRGFATGWGRGRGAR